VTIAMLQETFCWISILILLYSKRNVYIHQLGVWYPLSIRHAQFPDDVRNIHRADCPDLDNPGWVYWLIRLAFIEQRYGAFDFLI
jgi:hypothetical protein